MQLTFETASENETAHVAQEFARISKQGDVWMLRGTLGAGKSVFARAFIQYLTGAKEVPSPTFTLVQMYAAADFDIYHYDLYRLKDPEEIFELGVEEAFYSGVCLIEWPERMGGYAPKNVWLADIKIVNDRRIITIAADDADKIERMKHVG